MPAAPAWLRHAAGIVATTVVLGCSGTAQGATDALEGCRIADSQADTGQLEKAISALDAGRTERAVKALRALSLSAPDDLRVLYQLARAERRAGNRARAATAAGAALAIDPTCIPVATLMGELLEAGQAFADAGRVYAPAIEAHPDDVGLRERAARALVAAGQLEAAEAQLTWLREKAPDNAGYQACLAEVKAWRGAAAEAIDAFEKAQALDPKVITPERSRTWGDALRRAGRADEAVARYKKALAGRPTDVAALTGLGQALLELKRPEEAARAFQTASRRQPRNLDAQAGLARALNAAGRTSEAIRAYKAALKLAPDDNALRLEAAQVVSSDVRRRGEAVEMLRPLATAPDAEPRYVLAMAEILSWQPAHRADALEVLDGLLRRAPDLEPAWAMTRQTLLWMPPEPALIPWLDRVSSRYPTDKELALQRAASLAQDPARAKDAVAAYDQVLAVSPEDGAARLARAELKMELEPVDAAELAEELKRGAASAPKEAGLQARAGAALLELGRANDALEAFARGLAIDPLHLPSLQGEAEALAQLGRVENSQDLLEEAMRRTTDPGVRKALARQRAGLATRARREKARAEVASGHLAQAEAAYRALVAEHPQDVDAWVSLAALEAGRREYTGALEHFRRALAIDAGHLGALQGASGAQLALERYDEAERTLQHELEVAPSADARARLARVSALREQAAARKLLGEGRTQEALERLGRLYLSAPNEPAVVLSYAEALLKAKQYPAAADAYVRAVGLAPDNVAAQQGAAVALWQAKRYPEAREMMNRARARVSPEQRRDIDAQLLAWEVEEAEHAKARGELATALELYRGAYALAPDRPYVLKGVGGLYWSNGQTDLASKFYLKAAGIDPSDQDAVSGAAGTLMAQGLYEQAIAVIKSSPKRRNAELDEMLENAYMARDMAAVDAAWQRGERALAVTLAKQIAARNRGDVAPYMRLARMYGMDDNHLEALRWYHAALEAVPDSQPALLGLIATLQTMGRFTEAADLVAQARARDTALGRTTPELDGLEAAIVVGQGEAYERGGRLEEALAAYERAYALQPDATWVLVRLSGLYLANGQPEQALALYDRALAAAGEDREALKGRTLALLALKRADEAERTLQRIEAAEDAGGVVRPAGEDRSVRILHAELQKLKGDLNGALAAYQGLYARAPEDQDVARGLVGACLAAGRPVEALELLNERLRQRPNDPDLLKAAAYALRALTRSDLAVPILRKVDRYWPSPQTKAELEEALLAAYIEAAEAAKARGDLKTARSLYEEALGRAPDAPGLARGIAGIEAAEGQNGDARRDYAAVLATTPDDDIALIGFAATYAGEGEIQVALAELRQGWDKTRSPRIGLEWAALLMGQGRYLEADEVLKQVEDVLAERVTARPLTGRARAVEPEHAPRQVIARFEDTWRGIARRVPVAGAGGQRSPLRAPSLGQDVQPKPVLASAAASSDPSSRESAVQLPDIAPELPVPRAAPETAAMKSGHGARGPKAIDLWLVRQLLAGVRTYPDAAVAVGSREAARPADGGETAARGGAATPPPAGDVGTGGDAPIDADDYEAFKPTVSRERVAERPLPAPFDPVARTAELRGELAEVQANRLRLGGWFTARTGYAGENWLLATFGDVRLTLFPGGIVTLEPYVSPGMATNGEQTEQGVMVGLELGAHKGRLSLDGGIGASPIGFVGGAYPVGRVRLGLAAADRLNLSVEGAQEPVTDSLLSWAGEVDPVSGEVYGRVSRARLGLGAALVLDGRTHLSLGGNVGQYRGFMVEDNGWREGHVDLEHRLRSSSTQTFGVGADLTAFGFAHQLDSFEVGSGGYFSPSLFIVAKARGRLTGRTGDRRLQYAGELALGGQYSVCQDENNFCSSGARPVVSFDLNLSYRLSRGLELGARYQLDNVGADYTHNSGWIYLEKKFGIEGDVK